MTGPPLVSVVMPARDASATISSAIESICRQSFRDWELIVVDDASVDGTEAVVSEHRSRDPRVRLITGDGAGEPSARNAGIAAAGGMWIAMMDADDVARPIRLERQLGFMATHPHLFAAASRATLFVRDGEPLGRTHIDGPRTTSELSEMKSRGALLVLCHPTFMFDAEKLRAVGGYDPRFVQACDAEIINRAVYEQDQAVLVQPEELIWYRVAEHGMSTRGLALQRQVIRYLEYRNRTWIVGSTPIALSSFLAAEGDTRRFRRWRHDRGALLYRRAGILVGKRAWLAALPRVVAGLLLHPRYAIGRLRTQDVLRAAPWNRRPR
jgi:glycosyltransferase involved in cell wall biosynthesis